MGLVRLQRFLLALGMVIAVEPPAPPVVAADGPTATQITDGGLWSSTVARYLADPLWRDDEAYDAGHVLQVPLHAAFVRQWADRMAQFAAHFRRFMATDDSVASADSPLNRLQYLYLASRFAVLAHRSGRPGLVAPGLVRRLADEVDRLWFREPARTYRAAPFPGGIAERVRWKLDQSSTRPPYARAIVDQELYLMTIAADLHQIARVSGNRPARATAVSDALALAREVFRRHVTPTRTGGWLFQPGVWADHPDYAYAGHHNGGPHLAPARVSDIAEDTSHSHRLPLWLTSLSEAYGVEHPVGAYYDQLRHRLATQFLSRVIVRPTRDFPSFRTTNFMDGRNGLYRWGYVTHGPDNGYQPYELSGTLLLGWWSFLDHPGVCAFYDDQARRFPLPPRVIQTYIGPDTTRVRHRLLAHGAWYRNGLALQLVRVAADRCREVRR